MPLGCYNQLGLLRMGQVKTLRGQDTIYMKVVCCWLVKCRVYIEKIGTYHHIYTLDNGMVSDGRIPKRIFHQQWTIIIVQRAKLVPWNWTGKDIVQHLVHSGRKHKPIYVNVIISSLYKSFLFFFSILTTQPVLYDSKWMWLGYHPNQRKYLVDSLYSRHTHFHMTHNSSNHSDNYLNKRLGIGMEYDWAAKCRASEKAYAMAETY